MYLKRFGDPKCQARTDVNNNFSKPASLICPASDTLLLKLSSAQSASKYLPKNVEELLRIRCVQQKKGNHFCSQKIRNQKYRASISLKSTIFVNFQKSCCSMYIISIVTKTK